jgi:hypothetical protein
MAHSRARIRPPTNGAHTGQETVMAIDIDIGNKDRKAFAEGA